MPVLLALDNTLVDRDAAFLRWASVAVPGWGGDESDVAWLVESDANGDTPRIRLAQLILGRLSPAGTDVAALVQRLLYEHVEFVECYPGVLTQLDRIAANGASLVVVTNGDSQQQRMKRRHTGLDSVLHGSVISGDLGIKKPDRRLFDAARELSTDDGPTWMVGDHIEADIAGSRAAGCLTGWVSHGCVWTKTWRPTVTAAKTADVLAMLG